MDQKGLSSLRDPRGGRRYESEILKKGESGQRSFEGDIYGLESNFYVQIFNDANVALRQESGQRVTPRRGSSGFTQSITVFNSQGEAKKYTLSVMWFNESGSKGLSMELKDAR